MVIVFYIRNIILLGSTTKQALFILSLKVSRALDPDSESEAEAVEDPCQAVQLLVKFTIIGYLEGHGDVVSRLITRITGVTIWDIGIISNLLTKSL